MEVERYVQLEKNLWLSSDCYRAHNYSSGLVPKQKHPLLCLVSHTSPVVRLPRV